MVIAIPTWVLVCVTLDIMAFNVRRKCVRTAVGREITLGYAMRRLVSVSVSMGLLALVVALKPVLQVALMENAISPQ